MNSLDLWNASYGRSDRTNESTRVCTATVAALTAGGKPSVIAVEVQ